MGHGSKVMVDDNTSPTLAFLWAAQRKRGPDVQFNHIYKPSDDPRYYTALWSLRGNVGRGQLQG